MDVNRLILEAALVNGVVIQSNTHESMISIVTMLES